MGKTITVKTEYDIWKALQGNGILTEGCQLLSFKVNEETHLIDLILMLQPENTYEVWEQPVKYRL